MRRVIFAVMVALAAPSHAESLTIERYYPSEVADLVTIDSIAIERFDGTDGPAFGFVLEEQLASVMLNGARVFSLVDYRTRAKADALMSGSANVTVEQFPAEQNRNRCVERDGQNACIKYADVRVECVRRTVALSAALRLSAFADGRILLSRQMPERESQLICADDSQSPRTVEEIVNSLMLRAARSLPTLAPRRETEAIALLEDTKGLHKPSVKQFRDAVKLTKSDVTLACDQFGAIAAAFPNHGPSNFNVGLCHEWDGQRADAEQVYAKMAANPQYRRQAEAGLSRLESDRLGRAEWQAREAFRSGRVKAN